MKKLIFLFLFISAELLHANIYQPNHNLFNAESFTNYAASWVNTYIFNMYGQCIATNNDLQYIANVMYFSFRRSQETVRSQESALKTLNGTWKGWQNIANRRLNPSTQAPHDLDISQESQNNQDFWNQYAVHQRISSAYDQCIKQVVHGNLISIPHISNGIKAMRDESRKVMLDALADIKKHLGKLFDCAFRPAFKNDAEIKRGITDFVMAYIPQLAVNTFIHADALHNTVSDDAWNMLYTVQDVGIQTWQAIENARMAFYKAHYAHVYRAMQQLQVHPLYFNIAFNELGILPTHMQDISLPDPDTL